MRKVYDPSDRMLANFSSLDGTMEFYSRINAILQPHFTVLDLGAGRGAWNFEDKIPFRRELRRMKGKVREYIGADVDPAVLTNPTTDRNILIREGDIEMPNASVDLIMCDFVVEHIQDTEKFRAEIGRVLKPGGFFCARTPHRCNYVSFAARIIKNARHAQWLRLVQPNRKAEDVFPTAYRCNTLRAVARLFAGWRDFSYLYTSEPHYYFGNRFFYWFFTVIHKLMPKSLTGNLFIFVQKPDPLHRADVPCIASRDPSLDGNGAT